MNDMVTAYLCSSHSVVERNYDAFSAIIIYFDTIHSLVYWG